MMRIPVWQAPVWRTTDNLTRAQLAMFHALGDQISLSEDDRRRALDLDDRTWQAWVNFLANGPLPADPTSHEMLRRLGKAAFILSIMAERTQGNATQPRERLAQALRSCRQTKMQGVCSQPGNGLERRLADGGLVCADP